MAAGLCSTSAVTESAPDTTTKHQTAEKHYNNSIKIKNGSNTPSIYARFQQKQKNEPRKGIDGQTDEHTGWSKKRHKVNGTIILQPYITESCSFQQNVLKNSTWLKSVFKYSS